MYLEVIIIDMHYKITDKEIEFNPTENSDAFEWLVRNNILIPVPEKKWPEVDDKYWLVDGYGDISWYRFSNDDINLFRLKSGNCFKTKEEAEEHYKEINDTLSNCANCRKIKCTCPKQIGAPMKTTSSTEALEEELYCKWGNLDELPKIIDWIRKKKQEWFKETHFEAYGDGLICGREEERSRAVFLIKAGMKERKSMEEILRAVETGEGLN